MNRRLTVIAFLICICSVFLAVLPLFGRRFIPTHDGEYHIIRIVEFSRMLGAGNIFPRWAPTLNSGYGVPVFQFNYPLPNYIGSFFRLFTRDAVYAFQVAMGLGYIVIVISMYAWAWSIFGVYPALIGAIVGVFVPYIFVDMYVRGSIGEIWAISFLFLSLFFVERRRYVLFAFSYAGLILSHNILGMVFTPFLLLYVLLRDKKFFWFLLWGSGLSSFFWLPALMEEQYVVGLNTVNFREHFMEVYEFLVPSWGSQFSATGSFGNRISLQLGLAPILSFIGAALTYRRITDKKMKSIFLLFTVVVVTSIFFMTRLSLSLWELLTPLQNVQYPWRLLSFVIPIASFAAAFWVHAIKKKWIGLAIAVLAVFLAFSYTRPATYEPRDEAYYLSRKNFTDGTSSMGNSFSTRWSPWQPNRPVTRMEIVSGEGVITMRREIASTFEGDVQATSDAMVRVHVAYYPGWRVDIDGKSVSVEPDTLGMITVPVPKGYHSIIVRFGETPLRLAADIVSLACVLWILKKPFDTTYHGFLFLFREFRKKRKGQNFAA